MKKIFLLVLGFVIFKVGYSQYPIQQYIGADSAIVTSKGGLQGRLINHVFTDTSQANTQRIRQYPGAMIFASGKLWVRNTTATGWTELAYGPITVTNIYNSDGTLTGNRELDGNGNTLTFTAVRKFEFSGDSLYYLLDPAGNLRLKLGNQQFTIQGDTASLARRISYTGNLGSTFTKYSLIDKNYVDSVAALGAGTVTSVATNNGTGITGGTITTTGTLAIDTNLISTRAWRQKGIDSVQNNLTSGLATKLNISDTASMLSPYKTFYPRTAISLTTTGSSGAASYNSSTGVLNVPQYTDQFVGTVTSVATNTGTGITGGTITSTGTIAADTLLLSTRAWRQKGIDSVTSLISTRPTGSGTTNYVSKWTSSTALGNSQIFDNGTSVGIGTASPSSTLEVYKSTGTNYIYLTNGASGTNNGVVLRYNSVDYMGMIGNFNSGELKVGGFNAGGYFLTFYSNNSERARIFANGNFAIGTTTDAGYKLDVTGTFRSTLDANINGLTVGKGAGSVSNNTALGSIALNSNTTGDYLTAVGREALTLNTTGSGNIALGWAAGRFQQAGNYNLYLGYGAGYYDRGSNNIFVGFQTGFHSTYSTSSNNLGLGHQALNVVDADYNIGVGFRAGNGITTGTYNLIVGSGTTANGITTGSYNTIIGSQITGLSSSLSNTIILADGQGNQRLYINSSGQTGIGTTSPNASALLDVSSTTKGFLPPRMTNAQMTAIATPAAGLVVYDTTNNKLNYYNGTAWVAL